MTSSRQRTSGLYSERGFTLAELLVASLVSTIVLGGAVMLTSQFQTGYRRQVEAAAAEQEGRYALEWIGKLIRGAGNNPFMVTKTNCPEALFDFDSIRFDPGGNGIDDDIRLQTDSNPPDRFVGGVGVGQCTQANEDVTVAYDDDNDAIVFIDNNLDPEASIRTDAVIDRLRFIYRDSDHEVMDTAVDSADNVRYVEIQITVRSRTLDPSTGLPVTRVVSSEVRVRGL